MRKYIRKMMKAEAEKMNVKPSRWVHKSFEKYQIDKYGEITHIKNKAKGTHKRNTWKTRIENYMPVGRRVAK